MGVVHLWLVGGGSLAASFIANSLLTDISVTLIPIVLGSGIPLVAPLASSSRLKLKTCHTNVAGWVQLEYEVRDG